MSIISPAVASDQELMLAVQGDDQLAFDELYGRLAPRAMRLAAVLCAGPEDARGIVEESFLTLWRARDRYRPENGSVHAWALGIVHKRALDRDRDARAPRGPFAQLPEAEREVIALAYCGGLSQEEIAARLVVPLDVVKSRMRLALLRLQGNLTVARDQGRVVRGWRGR